VLGGPYSLGCLYRCGVKGCVVEVGYFEVSLTVGDPIERIVPRLTHCGCRLTIGPTVEVLVFKWVNLKVSSSSWRSPTMAVWVLGRRMDGEDGKTIT